MRYLLVALPVLALTADRASEREALLVADRALSQRTAALGMVRGFLPTLTDGAAYLHPGAPLLRGTDRIRTFLQSSDTLERVTWSPVFADVSADGRLGYSLGFVRSDGKRGKYLACWIKERDAWRVVAYARTRTVPVTDSVVMSRDTLPRSPVRGRADPGELISADSLFAAMSVAQGAKPAFVAFAAEDAIVLGAGPQLNQGRQAIGAAFDAFPSGAVLAWWPRGATIAESGDLGCTIGEATIESLRQYTKYLTIWKRQRDGSWKFVADGGNARPAP